MGEAKGRIRISLFLQNHMVLDCVMTKLVEENVSSVVCIDLVESRLRVRQLQSFLLQQRHGLLELGHRNSPVSAGIDLVEHEPVVGVLPQVLDQILELSLRNIVVSVFGGSLESSFCCIKGPNDDWFEDGQFGQLHNIMYSLINFSQAKIAIIIDIEIRPILFRPPYINPNLPTANF